jgi:hypothetical protein
MSELPSLFGGDVPAQSEALAKLMDTNEKLKGGESEYLRLSIKGGRFREILNGEQVRVSKDDTMNIIIVDSASVSRTYFEGEYDPNADPVAPNCWSSDTEKPAPDVENPQASRCADCKQNIKGSGQGDSRACRFSQRMAVVVENDEDWKVYQFQIPATSIFGKVNGNDMPMQGYVRFLDAHKMPVAGVVTEMRFDTDSEVPKLFFSPVRPLEDHELNKVLELRDSEEVQRCLTLTVSQTDGVRPAKLEEPKEEKVKELFPDAKKDEEPVKEPKKMTRKKKEPPPEEDSALANIVGEWDD